MKNNMLYAEIAILTSVGFACGDAVTRGGYEGEPRAVLEGQISSIESAQAGNTSYLGLAWMEGEDDVGPDDAGFDWQTISVTSFPTSFTLPIYGTPPARSIVRLPSGQASLAFAHVVVVEDTDGDGIHDRELEPGDGARALGLSPFHVVVYLDGQPTAQDVDYMKNPTTEYVWPIVNADVLQAGPNLIEGRCPNGGWGSGHADETTLHVANGQPVNIIAWGDIRTSGTCFDLF